jgi:hypothetical protein
MSFLAILSGLPRDRPCNGFGMPMTDRLSRGHDR